MWSKKESSTTNPKIDLEEGSYSFYKPSRAHDLQFSNTNQSLLQSIHRALKMLKYNPNIRINKVNLRRKTEVKKFLKEIKFQEYRNRYFCGVE